MVGGGGTEGTGWPVLTTPSGSPPTLPRAGTGVGQLVLHSPPPSPWENKLGGGWPVPRDGGRWQPRKRLQEVTAWFPLGSPGRHFRQDGRAGAGYGKVGVGGGGQGKEGSLPVGMLLSPW